MRHNVCVMVLSVVVLGTAQPMFAGGLSLSVRPEDDLSGLMDRVRAERDAARPFEVVFEDGVYSVGETIRLQKADSNIVFRARNPGRVTLVGGTKFPASAAKRGVPKSVAPRLKPEAAAQAYALEVPAADRELFEKKGKLGTYVATGDETFPREGYWWINGQGDTYPCFTVDGLHMPLAGWPQKGEYYKQTKEAWVTNRVIASPVPEAAKWDVSTNSGYVCIWGFTMNTCAYAQTMKAVAGRDAEGHILVKKGWGEIRPGSRFRFINVMEELDEPGEWCYDFASGTVCFIPPEGYSEKSFLAIGTLADNFFRIAADGTTVEGIRFTAKIGLPAVAIEEKARNCRLQGCAFTALNTYAVFAAGRGTLVRSCDFTDISCAGVYLTGGSLKNRDRGGNAVENCLFERCCILHSGWASGGLFVAGFGNAARHNVIHDSVEHALDYSGFGHVIEYNRTSEASKLFGDSAAVYSPGGCISFGNIFRYNDIGARRGYVNAFYADDFSSGHQVYGNIFREFGHFGIFFGGGRDNLISNNVVTAGGGGLHIDNRGLWWPQYKEPEKIRANLVKKFDYTNDYVRALYPAFSAWNDETTNMCGYCNNSWVNNVMVDCDFGVDLQECRKITIPTNSLLSTGNVYVRNAGGGSTKFWRIGGVTRVAGTKESPLGVRADDNAALRRLCPGWQDIPFAKIGLYADQWRTAVPPSGKPPAPSVEPKWTVPACVETNRYIGWPTVCRRKDGELIAVFSGDRTAHVSKDGKVQAVRSTDGGRTWSAPETWVNSPVDDRDAGLVELPNGDLVLFYFSSVCYAGSGYTNDFVRRIGCDYATAKAAVGAFCRRSSDGGRTWGEPSRLRGIAPHGACVTRDGRLVLVSRGQRAEGNVLENDPAWATTTHKLYAEASADGGRSWTLLHEFDVPTGVDVTKIHEPHVVEAADGSLVAQFRTSLFNGVLLQSVSTDGGRSWTPLEPTALHGHPAHLIRLADGRLLTTYGRRSDEGGGSGVYVAVSSDNGRTWGREHKLSSNACNVYNFGYPATADLGEGKFLTVCYQQIADNAPPCLMATRWNLND